MDFDEYQAIAIQFDTAKEPENYQEDVLAKLAK